MSYNQKFSELRSKFPWLSFESIQYKWVEESLHVNYVFNLSDTYTFNPTLVFHASPYLIAKPDDVTLKSLLFHLGMIELISYWKAACPPTIVVKPFRISADIQLWWKKIYLNGLGEFFYMNHIHPVDAKIIQFESAGNESFLPVPIPENQGVMVPVGGGKDSVVTLELLIRKGIRVIPFLLNPTRAASEVVRTSGIPESECLHVTRNIDPLLLTLNEQGFLNGHTPFSAVLAFATATLSALTGIKSIALSNESSANEATIPGTAINHQYSKTYGFEKDFREYSRQYINPTVSYFSFLRPINELQIAKIFSGFVKYHPVFRSCNAGSKTGVWCGECPKCLFTYIILSPFLPPGAVETIFGQNLFYNETLKPLLDKLCGFADEKPFDCIGTINEVNAAMRHLASGYRDAELPPLMAYFKEKDKGQHAFVSFRKLQKAFDHHHFLEPHFIKTLEEAMDETTL